MSFSDEVRDIVQLLVEFVAARSFEGDIKNRVIVLERVGTIYMYRIYLNNKLLFYTYFNFCFPAVIICRKLGQFFDWSDPTFDLDNSGARAFNISM